MCCCRIGFGESVEKRHRMPHYSAFVFGKSVLQYPGQPFLPGPDVVFGVRPPGIGQRDELSSTVGGVGAALDETPFLKDRQDRADRLVADRLRGSQRARR